MPELTIRSMTLDDVEQTIQVQLAAFADLAKRQGEPPLTVSDEEIDLGLSLLKQAIEAVI